MQSLVDVQIERVDRPVAVKVRIGIVVGIANMCAVSLFVQVQIQRVGIAVVIQVAITQVAVAVAIGVELGCVAGKQAVIESIQDGVVVHVRIEGISLPGTHSTIEVGILEEIGPPIGIAIEQHLDQVDAAVDVNPHRPRSSPLQ